MRKTKDSTLKEPLIHISIWIRNDVVINEDGDEAEGSRSLPTKQINIRRSGECRSCDNHFKRPPRIM